ncbi:dGTPase [Mesorhizobium sp. ESP7-2]|uniref:anti-phage deoxyguanosine triphosphatase n=1 Tax=Mesorhizobium sp. ESP7-2 TaxID=2876622 RepID=UPI001CCBCC6D|nr:anti-phage deoxyguanosine triphosphatase [Mesorhizobium sp. ESP7-2]MBZ9709308.1 dGTPase [Mesorhizobium sp. ESP7-2]
MEEAWDARQSGWKKQPEDARLSSDIDYSRIVHSGSFRRLQGKTQILNLGDSDFYRTRLTHSLEVAQIAGGIARQLMLLTDHPAFRHLPSASLIQAIGFAHDLGHPPFGHGGEVALNYCMREHGGFEGNGHTIRIVSRLESFSERHGSDLSRRCLLGLLKYPAPYSAVFNPAKPAEMDERPTSIRIIDRKKSKPPKCFLDSETDVVDWVFEPLGRTDRERFQALKETKGEHAKTIHKSFDCSIMDIADDIAYGVHDLEDSIALGLIKEHEFRALVPEAACTAFLESLKAKYPKEFANDVYEVVVKKLFSDGKSRKHYIGRLVHHFMTSVTIEEVPEFAEPLLRFRAVMPRRYGVLLDALKSAVVDKVIRSANVQHLEFKGQKMVVSVFEAINSEPKAFLPADAYEAFQKSGDDVRTICDYVAGMTDWFLLKTYDRLFSPRMGSVFDKL